MDFYKRKESAIRMIDQLFASGESEDKIIFRVETRFAISEKFTIKRIEMLQKMVDKHLEDKEK